jgi:hypothetical protein
MHRRWSRAVLAASGPVLCFSDEGSTSQAVESDRASDSPASDVGLKRDIVRTPIPQGKVPEMGAYEYVPHAPARRQGR